MLVISLHQPFASACFASIDNIILKGWETRHWNTDKRESILIHATRKLEPYALEFMKQQPIIEDMQQAGLRINTLPLGAIIGQIDLVLTMKTEDWADQKRDDRPNALRWTRERRWGNYEPGRFCWQFQNQILLPEPIYTGGHQSFWQYPMQPLIK